nr:hypothetical protein [Candidatus Sigynarchaeota archaeon]
IVIEGKAPDKLSKSMVDSLRNSLASFEYTSGELSKLFSGTIGQYLSEYVPEAWIVACEGASGSSAIVDRFSQYGFTMQPRLEDGRPGTSLLMQSYNMKGRMCMKFDDLKQDALIRIITQYLGSMSAQDKKSTMTSEMFSYIKNQYGARSDPTDLLNLAIPKGGNFFLAFNRKLNGDIVQMRDDPMFLEPDHRLYRDGEYNPWKDITFIGNPDFFRMVPPNALARMNIMDPSKMSLYDFENLVKAKKLEDRAYEGWYADDIGFIFRIFRIPGMSNALVQGFATSIIDVLCYLAGISRSHLV